MKTQQEQIDFSNKLQELTDTFGMLVNQLSDYDADLVETNSKIQAVLNEMHELKSNFSE